MGLVSIGWGIILLKFVGVPVEALGYLSVIIVSVFFAYAICRRYHDLHKFKDRLQQQMQTQKDVTQN